MLSVGENISFSYLKNIDEPKVDKETCFGIPTLVDYKGNAERYTGTVESVRDISEIPLSHRTIAYNKNIKGNRSRYLYKVSLKDGEVKGFYDGRMIGTEKITEAKKAGVISRVKSVLKRKRKRKAVALPSAT